MPIGPVLDMHSTYSARLSERQGKGMAEATRTAGTMPTRINGYRLIAAHLLAGAEGRYMVMVRTDGGRTGEGEYVVAVWDGDNPTWLSAEYVIGYATAQAAFFRRVSNANYGAEFGA